jgi:hypothetical protein
MHQKGRQRINKEKQITKPERRKEVKRIPARQNVQQETAELYL